MKIHIKKGILIILAISFILPQVTYASWWNPFSWKIFHKSSEVKIENPINLPVNRPPSSGIEVVQPKKNNQTDEIKKPKKKISESKNKNSPAVLPKKLSAPTTSRAAEGSEVVPDAQKPESPVPQVFTCENDSTVQSRAYVVLLGLNDDNAEGARQELERLTANDSKTKTIWVYDYSKNDTLENISSDFISKFNSFVDSVKTDEIVIFGDSAGGTIAAYSAHLLKYSGKAELHTNASPLRGYGLSGLIAEIFLKNKTGLNKEIGTGFAPYQAAPANFKVYHHKTVNDSVLSECGGMKGFCDVRAIQNNNLPGSKEFYYPQYDHRPLMTAVKSAVVSCRARN